MLTERIENLRAVIDAQRQRGEPVGLDQMEALTRVMGDWARFARLLEITPVPAMARLDWSDLPAGVIPLARHRPATRQQDGAAIPDGAA